MRFKWCGDGDCPDWVLAEMATLSRLSSVKLKSVATLVAQGLISPPLNIEKVEKLLSDSKSEDDSVIKRCVSCVSWILLQSTRASCDASALGGELQQLGLPREHALALKRVYTDHVESLRTHLYQQSLRVNPLNTVNFRAQTKIDCAEMELETEAGAQKMLIQRTALQNIVKDLKMILGTMEELKTTDYSL